LIFRIPPKEQIVPIVTSSASPRPANPYPQCSPIEVGEGGRGGEHWGEGLGERGMVDNVIIGTFCSSGGILKISYIKVYMWGIKLAFHGLQS
jgi:hypothetical protein